MRRAAPVPLDGAGLDQLALGYVGRYATTRAKLAGYLRRKLRERGWAGDGEATTAVDATVARHAAAGHVDDAGFAAARTGALLRRGYGARRIDVALRGAGVEEGDRAAIEEEQTWEAALRFARRRRIGPFAETVPDPDARRRALGAMMRAGHAPEHARRILRAPPGDIPEFEP